MVSEGLVELREKPQPLRPSQPLRSIASYSDMSRGFTFGKRRSASAVRCDFMRSAGNRSVVPSTITVACSVTSRS